MTITYKDLIMPVLSGMLFFGGYIIGMEEQKRMRPTLAATEDRLEECLSDLGDKNGKLSSAKDYFDRLKSTFGAYTHHIDRIFEKDYDPLNSDLEK